MQPLLTHGISVRLCLSSVANCFHEGHLLLNGKDSLFRNGEYKHALALILGAQFRMNTVLFE